MRPPVLVEESGAWLSDVDGRWHFSPPPNAKKKSSPVWFVRDDHTSVEQQQQLSEKMRSGVLNGGQLWFEFFYEPALTAVRAAFITPEQTDDEKVLAAVQEAVSGNGWSDEFNGSLCDLMKLANQHSISIHALDDPEWSQDAFEKKYGRFRGRMKYLHNRASSADDGEGSTSRWTQKALAPAMLGLSALV